MQWYYSKNGAQQGPVSEDELKAKIASGEVRAGDLGWREGMTDWLSVTQIPELMPTPAAAPGEATPAPTPGGTAGPVPGGVAQPGGLVQPGGMPLGTPPVGSGKATASMVLGICGLVFSCFACLGLILGILAIVFGSQVVSEARMRPELEPFVGRAKGGRTMGIIAIVLSIISSVIGMIYQSNVEGF